MSERTVMLSEITKDALRLMKTNMNLTQLIFLLFIVVTIFAPVLAGIKFNVKVIPILVIFFAVICSFMSGIFFAFKKALDYDKNPPQKNNPYDLPPLYFAEFFQGIGKYAKTYLFAGIVVLVLLFLFIAGFNFIVHNFIEIPQKFIDAAYSGILNDNTKVAEFFNSLTPQEYSSIGKLSLLTLFTMMVFGYITMLYPLAIVIEEKNFLKSFGKSLLVLVKNFPVSLLLYLFFNFILLFAGMVGAVFAENIIISVICILFQCYINVWYILSLFVYYEKTK